MQDSSKFFKQHPKYGKQHLMAENSYHLREMIEQCSRCSLPTGSGTSDQKSENVKSCVTPMPTNNPIFVIIRFIKTPLHYEKLRTWVTPLRSHINFIVVLINIKIIHLQLETSKSVKIWPSYKSVHIQSNIRCWINYYCRQQESSLYPLGCFPAFNETI